MTKKENILLLFQVMKITIHFFLLQLCQLRNISATSRLNMKIYDTPDEAIDDIPDGAKLLVGGTVIFMV